MVNKVLLSGFITTPVGHLRDSRGDAFGYFLLHHRHRKDTEPAEWGFCFHVEVRRRELLSRVLREVRRGDLLLIDGHLTAGQKLLLHADMIWDLTKGTGGRIDEDRAARMAHLAEELALQEDIDAF